MLNNEKVNLLLSTLGEKENKLEQNDKNHNKIIMKVETSNSSNSTNLSKSYNENQNFFLNYLGITVNKQVQILKISSAVFYAFSSFLIIFTNKIVLTSYGFPSFHLLGLGQMLVTLLILFLGKKLKIFTYPNPSRSVIKKVFPLPFFYIGNLIFGLGGTKYLSLPMFTVLRRFAILMTLFGEYFILGINQKRSIVITIFFMITGTLIAAINDLAFDAQGYFFVLSNDFFTAANGVFLKKKLDSKELGKYGLLYYNCLLTVIPLILLSISMNEFTKVYDFEHLFVPGFLISYFLSCIMGFVLMYSTILCTSYNSALTTTVVGCLKNILVTYVGMYIGGDYVFSITNFIGVNISMIASIFYSYITFVSKPKPNQERVC